ncbi:uncharacterized protein CIMG_12958 [Coccidioides immitis RS]|uniref:Uncharacterized protein n=1 Tax=Coccidioides immitis (strain RS) TaxID=246410 RepID=A0A0D8JT05_COCIM|nr:uncharacterized protein CIMG_12958 [Coccidioides immitis RS]KJF60422.1 hypothetical protein CIMG_12958 [Coccidioides immitis RS]
MKLYQTGFYTKYWWFTSSIESTCDMSKLNDKKILTYALTELDYIEKDLWKIYCKNNLLKNNWNDLKKFLYVRLEDPANSALEKNALHVKSINPVGSAYRDIKTNNSRL